MTITKTESVKLLADALALVYHEARNARHLVKNGYLLPNGWEQLLSLPTEKFEAWRAVQVVREDAANAITADKAIVQFEKRFGKNLASLSDLYANEHWKHASAFGGHAWRRVTTVIGALGDAIELGNISEIERAVSSLLMARHNNGQIRDKIAELDTTIGIQTGPWWRYHIGA
jgi:hypothetical protein